MSQIDDIEVIHQHEAEDINHPTETESFNGYKRISKNISYITNLTLLIAVVVGN